jgi:hypothetical protein
MDVKDQHGPKNNHAYELWTFSERKLMKKPSSLSWVRSCELCVIALTGFLLVVGCGSPEKKAITPKKLPPQTSPQARTMMKELFGKDEGQFKKAVSMLTQPSAESTEVIELLVKMAGWPDVYSRHAEEILVRVGSGAVEPIIRDLQTMHETADADAVILARHRGGWDRQGSVYGKDPVYVKAMRNVHLVRVLREIGQDSVGPLQQALVQAKERHRDLLANWLDWAFYGDGAPGVPGWPTRN